MRFIAIATACFLGACAPEIVYKPVPVQVPVEVPCKAPLVQAPMLATKGVKSDDSLFIQAKALAETNEQRKAYEVRLLAALRACQ